MKNCPNCKFDISNISSNICPDCRASVERQKLQSEKGKIRNKLIIPIIISLIVILGIVGCTSVSDSVTVESLSVLSLPDKVSYFVGEELNSQGLILKVVYKDGSEKVLTEGIEHSDIDQSLIGTQTIEVVYGEFTTSFDIELKEISMTGVEIEQLPSKTEYYNGDKVDTAGLTLKITYNNGTSETVTDGYSYSPETVSVIGTEDVVISYNGKDVSYEVSVNEVLAESIAIAANPVKTSYFVGDKLDTEGLTLSVTYNNGSTQTINSGFTCSPESFSEAGVQSVTVTYEGKTSSFDVEVEEVVVSDISIKTTPSKTSYYVGDKLNTTGLTLTATYNNGSTQVIDGGFTCSTESLTKAGTQSITVTYGDKTANFNVSVSEIVLSSISIKTNPSKTSYYVGDVLDTTGLTLTAKYNNGSTKTVSSGFTCQPVTFSKSGTYTLSVTYGGKTAQFKVTAKDLLVSHISIKTKPSIKTYYIGDKLDTEGLTLTVTYSNGSTATVNSGFTCQPETFSKAGTQTITVSYGGKISQFQVSVRDVYLSRISIKTKPTKTSYSVGDKLDTTGLTLTATYNDGSTKIISSGFTCSSDSFSNAGSYTVTVTYGGKATTFKVSVSSNGNSSSTSDTNTGKGEVNEPGITTYYREKTSTCRLTKDYSVRKTDAFSYCISETTPNDVRIVKRYKLKPNTVYVVLADVKTKDVVCTENPVDSKVYVCPFGASISIDSTEYSVGVSGTSDWKTVQAIGTSNASGYLDVSMNLGYSPNYCTGTAWFENIRIIPLNEYYDTTSVAPCVTKAEVFCTYNDDGVVEFDGIYIEGMRFGLNNKGESVGWEIRITLDKDVRDVDTVKCSWTNKISVNKYVSLYDDFGWSLAKLQETFWRRAEYDDEEYVIITLPDDPSIEGYHYIEINGTKIVVRLIYLGNYTNGKGWYADCYIVQ